MSIVTPDDVAADLGRAISSEEERAQVALWIRTVELRVARRLGPLTALDQEALKVVIPAVVARRVRNPEGKITERIDDYSYSLSSAAAHADLTLTADEWDLLTPARVSAGAWGIRTDLHAHRGLGVW